MRQPWCRHDLFSWACRNQIPFLNFAWYVCLCWHFVEEVLFRFCSGQCSWLDEVHSLLWLFVFFNCWDWWKLPWCQIRLLVWSLVSCWLVSFHLVWWEWIRSFRRTSWFHLSHSLHISQYAAFNSSDLIQALDYFYSKLPYFSSLHWSSKIS